MANQKASLVRQLTSQEIFSRKKQIASALTVMAVRRQAPKLSTEDMAVYTADLLHYPMDLIEDTCRDIGDTERQEGETAFPTIARIKSMMTIRGDGNRAREVLREEAAWKAQWERERAEDIANGIPRGADAIAEMERMTTPKDYRAVPRYPDTPQSNAKGPWERLGLTHVEYEAQVDYKRALAQKMRDEAVQENQEATA